MTDATVDKDRYYPNVYIGQEDLVRPTAVFQKNIQDAAMKLFNMLEMELEKEKFSSADFSVYTGSTGIALLYWRMSRLLQKPDYHKKALNLIEPCIARLNQKRFSFLGGDAGPLALLAVLYHEIGDDTKKYQMIEKLLALGNDVFNQTNSSTSNELLYGRAGYLYSLLFVNSNTTSNPSNSEKLIDSKIIQKVVDIILQEGQRNERPYLYYEWHDKCYLGAGHGILGIIQILLTAHEFLDKKALEWIRKTLDWLLTLRFPSGNIPSSLQSRSSDRLVHWCHGASGAIFTWFLANQIFNDDRYLAAARDCASVIWDRGLLRKGYSLCHGVSSSTYGLMAAYIYTKESKYLEQAHLFLHWCFTYDNKCSHIPDRPLSLFEGLAGTVYMLADFGWGESPKFPAFLL